MGAYFNPGRRGFERIRNGAYVDKTGMLGLINRKIGTTEDLICVSRPRRFGKSFAAQMLCAYYDKSCDSHDLFDDMAISSDPTYAAHLNQYNVIYLDMTQVIGEAGKRDFIGFIREKVANELYAAFPDLLPDSAFSTTLLHAAEYSGRRFVMIIDEWDAPIREIPEMEEPYLEFLRVLFKSSGLTSRIFAAAYMTGILPIKKNGSQSAISDFREYTFLDPGDFAEYTGFTENEVKRLCKGNGLSFESAQMWYDGYSFREVSSVYNPYSVMCAVRQKRFQSYWKKTSAAEALLPYINMDLDGLQQDIVRLIAGETIPVDTDGFENDLQTFHDKSDVLTLLIHLGYLAYEEVQDGYAGTAEPEASVGTVRIPNEEIRREFSAMLRKGTHKSLLELVRASDDLLSATISGNEEKVAELIESIRDSEYSPTFYNNEQALRYLIKFAYIACVDQYSRIEELPSGRGIADVVFVPKRLSPLPALIVELKWNRTADGALAQIKDRRYPSVLKNYGGDLLLVGINYDERGKTHTCSIERITG